MDKKTIFLIIFGIIIFGLRLFNINEAIYDDESNFAYSLTVMDEFGFNPDYPSSQLHNLLYKPLLVLFGLQTWVFRLLPWLFGIINMLLVYIFTRRNWGQNAAFYSTLLMLVSFYPALASLQFDIEGNLIMFLILLMFFSFLEYEKSGSSKNRFLWQLLSGISLGAAVASKYNSVYVVFILLLYSLSKNCLNGIGIRKTGKDLFLVYAVGLLVFIFSILIGFLLPSIPETVINSTHFFSWYDGFNEQYRPESVNLLGLAMYVLWSTPLLFGFYVIALFKRNKDTSLPRIWITITILFYTFVVTYGSLDRYFMNTIPALVVLGGYYTSRLKFTRWHLIIGSFSLVVFLSLLFALNSAPFKYIARFPELYFRELKNFNINFLFAYTSASGPTFGINFTVIFWSFLLSFAFLLLCLLYFARKREIASWFFLFFMTVALGFNIFLVTEYLFHPTGVNVSDVKWEMIDYVRDNNIYPIYTNDQGIQWYFEHDYLWQNKITQGFGDNEIGSDNTLVLNRIQNEGGTILLLHWTPLPDNSPSWEVVKACKINKQFYSKNILIGEAYNCNKNNYSK